MLAKYGVRVVAVAVSFVVAYKGVPALLPKARPPLPTLHKLQEELLEMDQRARDRS
jgi:hypothetical protein